MDLTLTIVYGLLLLLQIFLLIRAWKIRSGRCWTATLCVELVSLLAAAALAVLFDRLPGYGIMPGLTWFAEAIFSMAAAVGYAVMLVLSVVLRFVRKDK